MGSMKPAMFPLSKITTHYRDYDPDYVTAFLELQRFMGSMSPAILPLLKITTHYGNYEPHFGTVFLNSNALWVFYETLLYYHF